MYLVPYLVTMKGVVRLPRSPPWVTRQEVRVHRHKQWSVLECLLLHPMCTFAAFPEKRKNEINRADWLIGWQVGVFIVLVVGKHNSKRVETVLRICIKSLQCPTLPAACGSRCL